MNKCEMKIYGIHNKMRVYENVVVKSDGSMHLEKTDEGTADIDDSFAVCRPAHMKDRKDNDIYENDIVDVYDVKTGDKLFCGVIKFGLADVAGKGNCECGKAQCFYVEFKVPSPKNPSEKITCEEALGNRYAHTESANLEVIGNTVQDEYLLNNK